MESDRLSAHLDDGALLHLVDEDAHPIQAVAWAEHVTACEQCRTRLETRRRESARVRAALAELQLPAAFPSARAAMEAARGRPHAITPVRGRSWLASWPRAAAAILILLLPVGLVPPVRAALVEWIRQGLALLAPSSSELERPAATPAGSASGFTLSFTPTAGVLRITVERPQAGGELVVVRGDGAEGSLAVEGENVEALVTEDGLRIRNDEASEASFRLSVPAALRELTVQIGAGAVRTVSAEEMDAGWRMPLR